MMDLFETGPANIPATSVQKNGKCIIGIDPGTSGSICSILGDWLISEKMPETPKDILTYLKSLNDKHECVCYMEKVQGLPGMGGSPMFNFGKGFGYLEMALIALNIRTVTVTPQKWQKHFQVGTKGKLSTTQWKNKLKAKAQQLRPNHKVFLWNADAILITEYGKILEQ